MKKSDMPSQYFVGAILRGFDRAEAERADPVTCSMIWDYIVMECLRRYDGFNVMFAWDTSTAVGVNRVNDIMECIRRGLVPGLRLVVGDRIFVERY
jgi:hypothetical protein